MTGKTLIQKSVKTNLRPEGSSVIRRLINLLFASLCVLFALSGIAEAAAPLIQTVKVGDHPTGLAFDGENVWVVNSHDDTVTKVRAKDGVVLGTFPVPDSPGLATFDGENIWVTHAGEDVVSKVRVSDGQILGSFAVGQYPNGILFDGENIWTSNLVDQSLTKLRASDGALLGTFPVSHARGMTFDGENIWVANDFDRTVTKVRASDGAIQDVIRAGKYPTNVLFDGVNIWIADSGLSISGNKVTKLLARNGRFQGQFTVDDGPGAMTSDGTHLWVSCFKHDTVVELGIKDGSLTAVYELRKGLYDILFDGSSIWVTNSGDDKVTKITPATLTEEL